MMKDQKQYDPKQFEDDIYAMWQKNKCFSASSDSKKPPFCIIMPPPNVTSVAHIGHAMDGTLQDILVRYKRMSGYEALWLPGADHAAIATENKLVEKLAKEGKTKQDLGRNEFDKYAWEWYNYYGGAIMDQFKKMGFSADWDKYRFTMDEHSSKAVLEAFVKLYNKGMIYRGSRLTNWCTTCQSVISDDEVVYSDEKGHMWHIRYPYADGSGYIVIATTRPETMFGDTAVAVNPKDKRYTKLVGKMLKLPLTDREIPIIADDYVEKEFGTGMVKITPAHDPNDYEIGKRHNLAFISVIKKDGTLDECAGKYAGKDSLKARDEMIAELKNLGLLEKIEDYSHNVGHCERCKHAIEPIITEQWFVKMDELVKPAIECVKNGSLKIYAKKFEKNYLRWLENTRDWCVSRQLWTGHRIPIFYCKDCGHVFASSEKETKCAKCGSENIRQDEDVLDTWFSSALWPFSTLGWPENTKDLNFFYPTTVLVTAYDILTQWVTKMVYMGIECAGDVPFKNTLIHGLVRDELGRKMSKSLGNGIDPLQVTKTMGADALRIALVKDMSLGLDTRFGTTKLENARAFINKLWNASKFVSMHTDGIDILPINECELSIADKWILSKTNELAKQLENNFNKFDLGLALSNTYNFVWNDFCDWYIELTKTAIFAGGKQKQNTVSVLHYVLMQILKFLHPFIPFVTEYIYGQMKLDSNSILCTSAYPVYDKKLIFKKDKEKMEQVMDLIKSIRNVRAANNVSSNEPISLEYKNLVDAEIVLSYIQKLTLSKDVKQVEKSNGISVVSPLGELFVCINVDDKAVAEKLEKDIKSVQFEIERSEKMLSNSGFVAKAPAKLIEAEKSKLESNKNLLKSLLKKREN